MRREISLRAWVFAKSTLSCAELGRSEQVAKERQHLIGVFFQAGERQRSIGLADLAFDGRGHVLQFLIQLIAGSRFGAARSQHFASDSRQALLAGRIEQIAGADQGCAADQRQLVILEQQHLHSVRKRDLGGFGNLERRQRRILQILVGRQHDRAAHFGLRASGRRTSTSARSGEDRLSLRARLLPLVSCPLGCRAGRRRDGVNHGARFGNQILLGHPHHVVRRHLVGVVDAGE